MPEFCALAMSEQFVVGIPVQNLGSISESAIFLGRWLSVSSGIVFLSNNWLILKIFTHPYSDHFRTDRYSPKTRKSEIPTTAAPRSQLPYMPALSSSRSRSLLRSVEAGSPPAQAGIASLVPGPSLFQCVSFSLAHFKPGTPPTLSLLDLRHNLQMFL